MWSEATITNAGLAIYNRWLGGEALTLTAAKGGNTITDDPAAATDLVSVKQTLTLVGTEATDGGQRVKVQVTSTGLASGYTLRQVGIWGKIGSESALLLILLQDPDGVAIPSASANADFVFDLSVFMQAVSAGHFSSTIDPDALVSRATMKAEIAAHNTDSWTHQDIRQQMTSPFNFKGSVADLTALAAVSNPDQNDTYYVVDKTCRYSWTGSAWGKSSMDESEYEDELSDLQHGLENTAGNLEAVIGHEIDVTVTPTISGQSVNGVTASYENGKLKVYGAASGNRWFLCLNGQGTAKASTGDFSQTLPAGRYIVHIAASGYLSGETPKLYYTRSKFGTESIGVGDGEVIAVTDPVMVGLRFVYNESQGTSDNPGYYDVRITPVLDKKGLVVTNDVPVIPDGADIDDYTTPGTYKITNNTHAGTIDNLPVSVAGKLVVLTASQTERLFQIYFAFSATDPVLHYRSFGGETWCDWKRIAVFSSIELLKARVSLLEKSVRVVYEAGTWGDATERVNVYLPAADGYMMIRMYHFIDAEHNCDGWQIHHAYHVDDSLSNLVDLTISGEWECAVHLANRDGRIRNDFSGGHTHGDEVMTGVTFLLDGAPVDISEYTTVTLATEFRVIQTSELFDPYDHETVIAEHGKEYVFSGKTLTVNQSVLWKVAEPLTNCFLAMFLPSKNYVDRAAADCDFKTLELATATGTSQETITKHNAAAVDMWDTAGGLSAQVSVPVYPTGLVGGDRISISDNGGGDYNKLYFKVCGDGQSVRVGDLWKSRTVYQLNYYAEPEGE